MSPHHVNMLINRPRTDANHAFDTRRRIKNPRRSILMFVFCIKKLNFDAARNKLFMQIYFQYMAQNWR